MNHDKLATLVGAGTIGLIGICAISLVVGISSMGSSSSVTPVKTESIQKETKKEEDKSDGFHCLSAWDGSHRGVENWVKNNLRDPDSYQHKETRISPVKDGKHVLTMSYRAKNGFGGYVPGLVIADVDNATCKATIISN